RANQGIEGFAKRLHDAGLWARDTEDTQAIVDILKNNNYTIGDEGADLLYALLYDHQERWEAEESVRRAVLANHHQASSVGLIQFHAQLRNLEMFMGDEEIAEAKANKPLFSKMDTNRRNRILAHRSLTKLKNQVPLNQQISDEFLDVYIATEEFNWNHKNEQTLVDEIMPHLNEHAAPVLPADVDPFQGKPGHSLIDDTAAPKKVLTQTEMRALRAQRFQKPPAP
ncbi:MAG: hypothetical protein WCG04_01895, partial [Alphaproteobacteria bacterium]